MELSPFLLYFTSSVFVISALLCMYFKHAFTYWKKKNVPFIEPSIPLGSIDSSIYGEYGQQLQKIYTKFRAMGAKYGGFYILAQPVFMPVDTTVIRAILATDFSHFDDKRMYNDEKREPLSCHLFALNGEKWKTLRAKMTPTFSTSKIKMMSQIMLQCGEILEHQIGKMAEKGTQIDISDISSRYTIDVICSCVFGFECNSLSIPDSELHSAGEKFFENTFMSTFKLLLAVSWPKIMEWFNIKVFKSDFSAYFTNLITNVVDYRENNNVNRQDLMNLLIQMKNNNYTNEADGKKYSITHNELLAQCFLFFVAGYESSATTMNHCFYELCQNQDIQDKLRDEIRTVLNKYDGHLCYEAIMDMTYLENVFSETLRKYPAVVVLNRKCSKDYKIPGTDITIDTGTTVVVSTLGLHHDPAFYPDPEKFDPDRFTEEEKLKRPAFSYLPFGDGPKNCIGLRFGQLQTKIGIINMLKNYRFTLDPETKLPLIFLTSLIVLKTYNKIWLKAEKII